LKLVVNDNEEISQMHYQK